MEITEIKRLVSRYSLNIADDGEHIVGRSCGRITEKDRSLIAQKKPEILAYLKSLKDAATERINKRASIHGIREIEEAKSAWSKYYADYDRATESECPVYPDKPSVSIEALLDQYPEAAAYLLCESYSASENYMKSSIGQRAIDAIVNGADFAEAVSAMKSEWKAYCEENAFND